MTNPASDHHGSRKQPRRSLLGTIIAAVVLVAALILSRLTGIDLLGITTTPTPEVTATVPTITPAPPTATPRAPTVVPDATQVVTSPGAVKPIAVQQGFGAAKGFWQVFFTAPSGSSKAADYVGGVDVPLAIAISGARATMDIAAFEFNNPVLTRAVLDAKARGVTIRLVTDDEHGIEDEDSTVPQFIEAGIPVVDDARSAFMHNKFIIIDSTTVWTGSTNFTVNDVYRNNNNLLSLRSRRAVEAYQAEFNEMFEGREFGPRSTQGNVANFTQDGTPVRVYYAPEEMVLAAIIDEVNKAQNSIRFMAFSYTDYDLALAMMNAAQRGVSVQGIWERVGSETESSELRTLFCAGLDARQDGNKFILHHKVVLVDNRVVLTGSFNYSTRATVANDENLVIIEDPDLAAQYLAEFDRRWAEALVPARITCS